MPFRAALLTDRDIRNAETVHFGPNGQGRWGGRITTGLAEVILGAENVNARRYENSILMAAAVLGEVFNNPSTCVWHVNTSDTHTSTGYDGEAVVTCKEYPLTENCHVASNAFGELKYRIYVQETATTSARLGTYVLYGVRVEGTGTNGGSNTDLHLQSVSSPIYEPRFLTLPPAPAKVRRNLYVVGGDDISDAVMDCLQDNGYTLHDFPMDYDRWDDIGSICKSVKEWPPSETIHLN
jgi:hypothetical protein